MSAESRRVKKTEVWKQWEGRVVDGVFPLRRFLGGSTHSAVFLTEYTAKRLANVAIKFVPADALQAEDRLAQWRTAAKLSHPHLIRLFDLGRYRAEGREFLFVVMEYAEQTLAQVLQERTLSRDEAQELLRPTLDTLAFLHRNQLVHSQIKPSNFLAINDQLKLASDTIRLAGNFASGTVRPSPYDPPEQKGRGVSTAGDVWGLGVTMIEALTRRAPTWPDKQRAAVSLPANFPAPFADMVQRCLSLTPADRPTVMELQAQYKTTPQANSMSQPERPARAASRKTPAPHFTKRPLLLTIAVVLLISLVVQAGLYFLDTSPAPVQPPAVAVPAPVAPEVIAQPNLGLSGPVSRASLPPATTSPAVLLEVSPEVPRTILEKIQDRTVIKVRVLVDPSGDVIGALLDSPRASEILARLANDAALEWKFVPDENQEDRVWVLSFAFSRDGITTEATAVQ